MEAVLVALMISAAVLYVGRKTWTMIKPGPKAGGCGCGSAQKGCSGCPVAKP